MLLPTKKTDKISFNRLGDESKVDNEKVGGYMKETIKNIRKKIYPNLNDDELENFNNKLSRFLFF